MNNRYAFGKRLIRSVFPFLILFSGTVLATTSGSTGPVFGRQITINDPVVLGGSLEFTSTAPAVTDLDGESVDHWLYQWKVDGVAVGAEAATTKADFSEISYRARPVDFNKKIQLCVKAVSPTGCYPDATCRSDSVCSAEVNVSEPVVDRVSVGVAGTANNALANGVSENVVRIEVNSADGRNLPGVGYPVTLTASNGATIQNSITTGSLGFAYPRIKSNTGGDSVITATTGYGSTKSVTVNFRPVPNVVGLTTTLRTWPDASSYCQSLGARLPTLVEFRKILSDFTSLTNFGPSIPLVSDMCIYGWPILACGGNTNNYWTSDSVRYWVSMANGTGNLDPDFNRTNHVACVR